MWRRRKGSCGARMWGKRRRRRRRRCGEGGGKTKMRGDRRSLSLSWKRPKENWKVKEEGKGEEKWGRQEWLGTSSSGRFACPFCDNTEIDLFISAFKILTCNYAISLGIQCRAETGRGGEGGGRRGGPLSRSHSCGEK